MVGQQRHVTSVGDKAAMEAKPRTSVEHKITGRITEEHDHTMDKVSTKVARKFFPLWQTSSAGVAVMDACLPD
jgi:hypothetical protein